MFRSRSWFGGGLWKPKNPHSLEHLKYLYNVLSKNQVVSETNRSLLVETLRSIAEILIWGDQNDSTVFDFFLEKNMLAYFLKIMRQKCGSYVCVQLLQTLNILFENIRNETSLYYLLSNNHVNSIIVHKFDFSDEEVMAYFISFLKTLSLKLNCHTIHFFYNEHTHDFPLYTEAIKFFNNSESMVRIAVRTLTLNVYRVREKSMLKFIRDKTAAPYFSNLVWFISNHVIELDSCIRNNSAEQESRIRLADLVAEHLDHLHYLNDILCLQIEDLNQVLTEHLIQRLFIPLYLMALERKQLSSEERNNTASTSSSTPPPKVSTVLSLFLLSQVFLITTHAPLVELLANLLINGNRELFLFQHPADMPVIPLTAEEVSTPTEDSLKLRNSASLLSVVSAVSQASSEFSADKLKSIEEKYVLAHGSGLSDLTDRPILSSIYESLDSVENDYAALFTLCLLSALHANAGINPELLNRFFHGEMMDNNVEVPGVSKYNEQLVDRLVAIICLAVKNESKIRVITLQLLSSLLLRTVMKDEESFLGDAHLASIEGAREENILLLQNYYKTDELFLELFEDEYLELSSAKPLSIEHLMMDSNLLLPPAGSPLTGIDFDKRLPCGEVERSRRSMRIYFLLRKLSLTLRKETEKYLPLTNTQNCVRIEDNLDLTNSDMLSCTVITRDNVKTRRFLVVDVFQLILVDPSNKRMGWGVVKFVGFLQDIEVLGDKDDSRCLHITVKTSPTHQRVVSSKTPVLQAKFMFDDHIRCMAAKQRLVKGRQKARQRKLHLIARLLDLAGSSPSPPQNPQRPNRRPLSRSDRPLYNPISRALPGLAVAVSNDISPGGTTHNAVSYAGRRKSREASPSLVTRTGGVGANLEEEIPLGNIRQGSRGLRSGFLPTARSSSSGFGFVHNPASAVFSANQGNRRSQGNHTRLSLVGLNSTNVNSNSVTTHQVVNSPTEGIDSAEPVVTPQSETSFMTISATTVTDSQGTQESFSPPEIHSSNNQVQIGNSSSSSSTVVQQQPNKKQKGAIETV